MNNKLVLLVVFCITTTLAFNHPNDPEGYTKVQTDVDLSLIPDFNFAIHDDVIQQHWESHVTNDEDDPPRLYAKTLDVDLIGKTMLSYGMNNVTINCFQGLRYANKPTRFQPPIEMTPPYYEESEYVANHLPDKCSQHGIFTPNIAAGTEDCLFLSVYTPQLPDTVTNEFDELYPVMIFFHGGAFIWGDSSLYLPTRLLDQKVLLVVPHYRLGSFGFFSTMDARAPGNTGLYDQQMSMKWVQTHIESFGGDKNRVTIFGQSAGSASVNYHLIIPSSGGLMQNVIGESGSALEHWSLDEDPITSAIDIANTNGCEATNIDEAYDCMFNLDESTIALGINELSHYDRAHGQMGFRGAAPIIQNPDMDLSSYGAEILLTKPPTQYYTDRDFNKDVNLMIGANKNEGSFVFGIMFTSYIHLNNLTENGTYLQEQMIPDLLHSFGIDDSTHSLSESLSELYLAGADRNDFDSCTPGMIDLSGVLFQKAGTMETAKLHSYYKDEGVNTYLYAFEYESEDTSFNWLFMGHVDEFPEAFKPGVTHSDELLYLFSWPAVMDGPQFGVRDNLVKLWTNFATYGNPTPDEDDEWKQLNIEEWPNFDIENEYYNLMEESFHIEQRYSDRWTIANEEYRSSILGTTTVSPGENLGNCTHTDEEFNDLKDERDAYLATMIVFIVLFVVEAAACTYFMLQARKKSKEVV